MSRIGIGSNISSLSAQRRLSEGTAALAKTYERLSSGLRINSASDDAAGLSIATTLQSSSRVFAQGIRNFNDGLSLLNIADATVENLSSIVVRLKELAAQSANGTFGKSQREALNQEAQALSDEYFRIASSTRFNGRSLLNGSLPDLRLQGGFGTDGGIMSSLGGAIGTGAFSSTSSIGTAQTENQSGDLNGDGILDMVTISYGGGAAVEANIFIGNSDGSFTQTATYSMYTGSNFASAVADINGDGFLDIAAAGTFATDGYAAIRYGRGDGTFAEVTTYTTEDGGTTSIAFGDINNDGTLDMATGGQHGGGGDVTVRLGTGIGFSDTATTYTVGAVNIGSIALGDINNDGYDDLVASSTGNTFVRLGQADGGLGSLATFVGSPSGNFAMTLADVNGDGDLDSLVGGGGPGVAVITVAIGNGNGTFQTTVSYNMTGSVAIRDLEAGDVNGDGLPDIVASTNVGLMVRVGNGNGGFGAITLASSSVTNTFSLGDVNRDGVADIIGSGASLSVLLADTVSGAAPLLPFEVETRAGALAALSQFTHKLNQLSSQRGVIGAFQARLEVGIGTLHASVENYEAAAGRITDADVASESSNLLRLNILQQAATSVLTQANQQPALAISLLSNDS